MPLLSNVRRRKFGIKHLQRPVMQLDGMCIFIEKDKESPEFADYFFVCDVRERDPRYKSRYMCTGQRRGLFRVSKSTLDAELLFPMDLDVGTKCFQKAASKVLSIYKIEKAFPEKAQFASG